MKFKSASVFISPLSNFLLPGKMRSKPRFVSENRNSAEARDAPKHRDRPRPSELKQKYGYTAQSARAKARIFIEMRHVTALSSQRQR